MPLTSPAVKVSDPKALEELAHRLTLREFILISAEWCAHNYPGFDRAALVVRFTGGEAPATIPLRAGG